MSELGGQQEPMAGPQPEPAEAVVAVTEAPDAIVAHATVASRAAGAGYPVRTTMPDELLRHDISDEELDMLGDTKRSFFHEFMWATIIGTLGAAPAAIHDLGKAYFSIPAKPLSGFELFEVILFSGFAVLAIFSGVMVRQEAMKDPASLKEKIRARTRSIKQT